MAPAPLGMVSLASRMRSAAQALLGALPGPDRATLVGAFDPDELTSWTYLPGARPGLRVVDLAPESRRLATELLVSSYSERGAVDLAGVFRTEVVSSGKQLDPAAGSLLAGYHDPPYWLRLLGEPGDDVWAWRLSGHHLVAQATVVGDVVSLTPQFFGTEPARVRSGPLTGYRALAEEEDLARRLLALLDDEQRALAVFSPEAPADILTRHDPVADVPHPPHGLLRSRMDVEQQQVLEALVRRYLERAPSAVSDRAWADALDAGLDGLTFGWAGGFTPADGHYYSVTGPSLLLEYDNTQDDVNHVHSVWRDLRHDWGGDLLRQHYRQHAQDPQHRHDQP